jgi:hypothetical protein
MKPNRLLLVGFTLCCLLASTNPGLAQGTAFTYQGHLNDTANPATGTYDLRFAIYDLPSGGVAVAGPTTNAATISNGLFTVALDFGPGVFTGTNRWLDIAVRTNGSGAFAPLTPRQPVTPAPYAVYAGNVNASGITGPIADDQLSANVARLNGNQTFTGPVNFSNGSNSFAGNFNGSVSVNSLVLLRTNYSVVAWGDNIAGQTDVPPGLTNAIALAAGRYHSLALRSDGTVLAWGNGGGVATNVPPGLHNVTAVGAGLYHSLALRSDGTVVAWGDNSYGQTSVPSGLSDVTAIAAGTSHNLALKSDGTVVTWGYNNNGRLNVPAGLNGVTAVAAGVNYSLAVRTGGTVIAWGDNSYGQTNVPAGLSNVTAVAAGEEHILALKIDGTVEAWGKNLSGQRNVPPGLNSVTALAAGFAYSLALRSDGTLTSWGGPMTIPWGLNNVVTIAGGSQAQHALAIRKRVDSPVAWLDGNNTFNGDLNVGGVLYANGSGLINVNASSIGSGTLSDERLSRNVVLFDFYSGNLPLPNSLSLDNANLNNGAMLPGLSFGLNTGEGISSRRTSGLNQYGLDFFTASLSRLSIGNNGNVGIGTTSPQALLAVNGAARVDTTPVGYNEGLSLNLPTDMPGGGYGGIHFHNAPRGAAYNNTTIKWGIFYNYSAVGGAGAVAGKGLAFVQNNTETRLYLGTNGNVGIGTTAPLYPLHLGNGAYCTPAGVWTSVSDRNVKEQFLPIDPANVLASVLALPITQWKYKVEPDGVKHLGPMAQDFKASFGLGESDKAIGSVDADGVALAAIQGLNQKLQHELKSLHEENADLKARLSALEEVIGNLRARKQFINR